MSDTGIAQSIRDLILRETSIVPTTHLTAQATSGDADITVADSSLFPLGRRVQFLDALGEEPIASNGPADATTTNLVFTGLGYSGLQHTHLNGTVVYSNIKAEVAMEAAPYIGNGDPFLAVSVQAWERGIRAHGVSGNTMHIRIYYHRLLDKPTNQQMAPDSWLDRQLTKSRADIKTLADMFDANWRLIAGGGQKAVKLGVAGKGTSPYIRTTWQQPSRMWDTPQLIAWLDLDLEADWTPDLSG